MGKFYQKLPKKYRDVLADVDVDVDGLQYPEISEAWREYEAMTLLEACLDEQAFEHLKQDAQGEYIMFREGWLACVRAPLAAAGYSDRAPYSGTRIKDDPRIPPASRA